MRAPVRRSSRLQRKREVSIRKVNKNLTRPNSALTLEKVGLPLNPCYQYILCKNLDPVTQVVSIDHLIQAILRKCKSKELLNLRLVSKTIKNFATRIMREYLELYFVHSWLCPFRRDKTLGQLNLLLKSSIIEEFPCSRFSFELYLLPPPIHQHKNSDYKLITNFLDLYGSQISHLQVSIRNLGIDVQAESCAMARIKQILSKTPNIEYLSVRLESSVNWIMDMVEDSDEVGEVGQIMRDEFSPLLPTDPEFHTIHSEHVSVFNKKLKVLEFVGHISAKVFEVILLRAPNLREAIPFRLEQLNYFTEPVNRTHLLSILMVTGYLDHLAVMEKVVEKLLLKRDVQLSTIIIDLEYSMVAQDLIDEDFTRRIVKVINDLIHCASESLERVIWMGLTYVPGVKRASIVSNLKQFNPYKLCLSPLR